MGDAAARLGGWPGAAVLLLVVLLGEAISFAIGGDVGGMLWVFGHFALAPILSVIVLVLTGMKAHRARPNRSKLLILSSSMVPIGILYLVISVGTWFDLATYFGLSFDR